MKSPKQTHITTRQMLPVFKVISDLEDPKLTNFSISPERENVDEPIPVELGSLVSCSVTGRRKRRKRMVRMDAVNYSHSDKHTKYKNPKSSHKCKKHSKLKRNDVCTQLYPEKLNFSANFTPTEQVYDIKMPKNRSGLFTSLHQDIYIEKKRELTNKNHDTIESDNNAIYEVPKDVIRANNYGSSKSRGSTLESDASNRSISKQSKSLLKDQKRKLTEKYEGLIVRMMDRCEEDLLMIGEKDTLINRMKDKLKSLHHINMQFADQHEGLLSQQLETRQQLEQYQQLVYELEQRNTELETRLQEDHVPVREGTSEVNRSEPHLVQICMSCSTKDILVQKVQEQNEKTQQDLVMMKNIVYRLNVQLSRYQEKIRDIQTNAYAEKSKSSGTNDGDKALHFENMGAAAVSIPSMARFGNFGDGDSLRENEDVQNEKSQQNVEKSEENWGDVNSHTLAPLLNAYQDSINDKDSLIRDYEKQFNVVTLQLKQALLENTALRTRSDIKEKDLKTLHTRCKELTLEKDKAEEERDKLLRRTETAEVKVKEIYEVYEDKVSALMRDYETVHREYFTSRNALATTQARLQALEGAARISNQRTVPVDMHERRIEDCKRLFEELKFQYGMEKEKTQAQLKSLQDQKTALERQAAALVEDVKKGKEELKRAQKDARLYRRAAVVFRSRLRVRPRPRPLPTVSRESGVNIIDIQHIHRIRQEIQSVKQAAYKELSDLEHRMRTQQRQAAQQKADSEREVGRLQLLLEHKERIVRHLIQKVADMEPDTLSDYQRPTAAHYPSSGRPAASVLGKSNPGTGHIHEHQPSRLSQVPGGYFVHRDARTNSG